MALDKQIYCYSIDTSGFYNEEEQEIQNRLLELYLLKKKIFDKKFMAKNPATIDIDFWKPNINKLIRQEKDKLSVLLDERLNDTTPRVLRQDGLKEKNIITLFESSLTRALGAKTNELTMDLMVLSVYFFQVFHNLVRDGFMYNGEKYIFLTASAGQIRKKMGVFIRESAYKKIEPKIMCGLTKGKINEKGGMNTNKFAAYLALNSSATDVWENFDIDKAIVVEDFETDVFAPVDYIDYNTYEVTRTEMDVPIPHMDGAGIMLDKGTRMVRMPWIKGLLITFPFDKFIEEKCEGKGIVYDIYGEKHDVIAEDIKYIFTKSQFKLWKFYSSWEEYKDNFKKYHCEACYCNLEEDFIPKAKINYQMLQTLSDISDDEIERITRKTAKEIETIGTDFQTAIRLLGATPNNKNPNYFQQGLMIYPELFRDVYHKDILKQTKKSLVKQAKSGRLSVNGRYQFISPDLYAFCEWLFLGEQNPKGLLANGEVYSSLNPNETELACLRSPHLYREWGVKTNKRNSETDKWFGMTMCVYTSVFDTLSKLLQFDCDGDKALVIQDRTLTAIAKRNMKDIVPLYYEMKKAKGGAITSESLYEGMINAYTGGNIGIYSNNITKIWNCGKPIEEEQLKAVKWLVMENNFVIDFAKTLFKPTRPEEADKIIKSYTSSKVPAFFVHAKDKDQSQVEPANESTMNRFMKKIPSSRIRYCKTIGKMDYRMLMNQDCDFTVKENPIVEEYNYWVMHQFPASELNEEIEDEDLWINKQIRKRFEEYGSLDYVVNTLVNYCYTVKRGSSKKLLWNCFGDVIVKNLRKNTASLGDICPICGRRFVPINSRQKCCCSQCAKELDVRNHRNFER